jgi:hypothetical protein
LQEIVQEPPAERGRADPHVVALDEPLRLGRGDVVGNSICRPVR